MMTIMMTKGCFVVKNNKKYFKSIVDRKEERSPLDVLKVVPSEFLSSTRAVILKDVM